LPRYFGHLFCEDINIERPEVPGATFFAFLGDGVMPGRQENAKSPLIICGEGCDFRSLFVLYNKSGIRERRRTRIVRSGWSRLTWAKRDHSFDPGSRSGLCLPGRKRCSHNEKQQNDRKFSESHWLIYSRGSASVNNDETRMTNGEGMPNDKMTNDRGRRRFNALNESLGLPLTTHLLR
jgi:hypothetical protein